jgi:hypothetical protein
MSSHRTLHSAILQSVGFVPLPSSPVSVVTCHTVLDEHEKNLRVVECFGVRDAYPKL